LLRIKGAIILFNLILFLSETLENPNGIFASLDGITRPGSLGVISAFSSYKIWSLELRVST